MTLYTGLIICPKKGKTCVFDLADHWQYHAEFWHLYKVQIIYEGNLSRCVVSRKRKKKNWEDEDYYDSDDDSFLDRTGTVEKKRKERMKRAGKVEEQPDSFESLVRSLHLHFT